MEAQFSTIQLCGISVVEKKWQSSETGYKNKYCAISSKISTQLMKNYWPDQIAQHFMKGPMCVNDLFVVYENRRRQFILLSHIFQLECTVFKVFIITVGIC